MILQPFDTSEGTDEGLIDVAGMELDGADGLLAEAGAHDDEDADEEADEEVELGGVEDKLKAAVAGC